MKNTPNFQDFIYSLCQYWKNYHCIWSQPYDQPMGAGTFHPHTFFKALGPEPWRNVYIQPCRRPMDGRYGKSPNRLQQYYQLQVFLKPAPKNILDIYLKSLKHMKINSKENDLLLCEDNWKGPTLGAWGLGWEVRANGEEITQFTYFQEFGGHRIEIPSCEITYGLERLFMYAHGYQNVMDIPYNENFTYGDIFYQNENEFSYFNFKLADTKTIFEQFEISEQKVQELCNKKLVLPAYDYVINASHAFNILDARGALSVTERQRLLGRVRECAKLCAISYCSDREAKNYPFLNKLDHLIIKHHTRATPIYKPEKDFNKLTHVNVLFELGVEEMPPDFQIFASRSLEDKMTAGKNNLTEKYAYDEKFVHDISTMNITISISARRIVFLCTNVPKNTPKREIDLWGPAEHLAKDELGNLTQAGIGFCKKHNLSENEISFKKNENSNSVFLFVKTIVKHSDFPTILVNEFKKYIYELEIPLKMRWLPAHISPSFTRPVRWLLCLVENKVLPIEMFGLQSSSLTYGHRILSPEPININGISTYENKIKNAHVIPCQQTRKKIILKEAEHLVKKLGENASLSLDYEILEKCIGITEDPHPFLGQFDEKYLKLPHKLIVSVLKTHMNYFNIHDKTTQNLIPYYIGIANCKLKNQHAMLKGSQKVVSSRLEDGAFYFESDLAIPIQSLREKLKTQIFQEGLGNLYDKSERLSLLVKYTAHLLNEKKQNYFSVEEIEYLVEAGRHCKNDLKTGCVQEFPDDMQGVMAGILIRSQNAFHNQKKSEQIALAIEEHYLPSNARSPLPSSKFAFILALADKLDSLILLLSGGHEPKGHHDPFGLRRLAIAIARLLNINNEHNIDFPCSIDELLNLWKTHCAQSLVWNVTVIKNFILERIKSMLKEKNFNPNNIEAISKIILKKPLKICLPLLESLEKQLENTSFLIPYKRARSMTHSVVETHINPNLFIYDTEKNLYSAILLTQKNSFHFFETEQFNLFFKELSSISEPLTIFFDSVHVNDSNIILRQNRLQLLLRIRMLYENMIDLSVVQVNA